MDDIRLDAKKQAEDALKKPGDIQEKEIAKTIKAHFDMKYGPSWHVVVGKSFAAYHHYEVKTMIFLTVGQVAFLIYKLG